MSTAGATFAADHAGVPRRPIQHFGRIVVVGGGCYGGYYVRQLGRAERAGAVTWQELVVVDRDASCAVARLPDVERPPRLVLAHAEWLPFFADYLARAADDQGSGADAIVPSPLMPHLMADWLLERARARWPQRTVRVQGIDDDLPVPWQRAGVDGTRYVSFAEWMCPINCIEPARCPETRTGRDWSLPATVGRYVDAQRALGDRLEQPLVFHCSHRAYGVGMIDVRDVVEADRAIARHGARRASFLVGTVSHCHGALRRITIDAPA